MHVSIYEHVSAGAHGIYKRPTATLELELQYALEEWVNVGKSLWLYMEEEHGDCLTEKLVSEMLTWKLSFSVIW